MNSTLQCAERRWIECFFEKTWKLSLIVTAFWHRNSQALKPSHRGVRAKAYPALSWKKSGLVVAVSCIDTSWLLQSVTSNYRTENVFIKDLSIKVIKSELTKNSDTDTEYKNVINEDFVNEFSELDLKVCSQTNKGMSYSSVLQHNVNSIYGAAEYVYNNIILNKALNTSQLQEYNIIQSYVNQYSTPAKKLNITLANIFKPYSLLTINSIFSLLRSSYLE
jgi:hypothetical protein